MKPEFKTERNLWRDDEIKTLLNIIEEHNILDAIIQKRYRSDQIFRFVESQMCLKGYTKKSYQQIWTKWKFLKSSYVTTRRSNLIPGSEKRTCEYYSLLHKILGNEPETIALTYKRQNNGSIKAKNKINASNSNSNSSSNNSSNCSNNNNDNDTNYTNEVSNSNNNSNSNSLPEIPSTLDSTNVFIKEEPIEEFETDIIPDPVTTTSFLLPKLQPISQMTRKRRKNTFESQEQKQSREKRNMRSYSFGEQPTSLAQSLQPNLQPSLLDTTQPSKKKRISVRSDISEAFYPDIEIESYQQQLTSLSQYQYYEQQQKQQQQEQSYPYHENGENNFEPTSTKKRITQRKYFTVMQKLATNMRQMQKELIEEFFRKQEELMREEHEFQRQQDEMLLRSFEEQTRILLDNTRNLLTSNVSVHPDFVYIDED